MDDQQLRHLTSSIDFSKPYDPSPHRAIYSSVCPPLALFAFEHVDPPLRSDHLDTLSDPPPAVAPCLLFYAVRNILCPSFIVGQIPDLLNLLAAVETLRRFAVLKSDEALEWQKYYEREETHGREQDVRLLVADEVHVLERFAMHTDRQRREYIALIRNLIPLYIHYLWTAPESCLLAKRLNDFFPGSMQGVDAPSELLFHVDLSEDEKVYFGQLKAECQDWMNDIVEWEQKREEVYKRKGKSEDEMEKKFPVDFRRAFPEPSKLSEMTRNIGDYISMVEDMVRKLEHWFAPSQGR